MVTATCLAILCLPMTLPTARPIASAPRSFPAATRAVMGAEQPFGGGEQVLALAGALGGQHRVAAGDQPLAGEVRRGDLGQVLLAEQGQLQRPVLGHELLDGGGAQRGDPPEAVVCLAQRADAGAGDHAAVADHDHPGQLELVPHYLDDFGERGRVAGVPGQHADRDRAALGVGEQPVLDLQLALLAVAGVAAPGQRAAPALQPRTGQVEQGHPLRVRVRCQVPAGELHLDRVLPGPEPVHRRVHVISVDLGHAQVGAERGVAPPGQGGQLRARAPPPGR